MEYPSNGRCRNCGAALPQLMHGACVCDFCATEYSRTSTAQITEISEADTGKAMSLVAKADAAYEKNKIGEAIGLLDEALKYDPSNALIWNRLGRSYRLANNLDRARECYQKALSLKPDAIEVIANLGVLEISCNHYQLAYQYCKRAYEAGAATPSDNAIYAANYAFTVAKTGSRKEALQLLKIARKRGYGNYAALKKMIRHC